MPLGRIHLAVFAQNLFEPRFDVSRGLFVLLSFDFDLEAQILHRQPIEVLSPSLLVYFELHFIDLFDMVDRHQGIFVFCRV
jgi:hypothetical protein